MSTFLLLWSFWFHPFFASVTEIYCKDEGIQVLHKVFTDDLETCIQAEYGQKLYLFEKNQHPEAEKFLKDYFQKNFFIIVGNEAISTNYVGFERDDDAVWVYFEKKDFLLSGKKLNVENRIFIRQIPEQLNILYFFDKNDKKSYKTDSKNTNISI
jgi:hypothetical protein